jgi:hypothetical protein
MKTYFKVIIISIIFAQSKGSDPDLPPCPTNIQFLPQNLPMHCRIPRDVKFPGPPGGPLLPLPPFFPPPPSSDKLLNPLPMPGLPNGLPPGLPPGLFPPGLPGPIPMPMPMMPGPPGLPSPKLPVIVMPFYSPDPSYKQPPHKDDRKRPIKIHGRPPRRPLYYDSHSDSDWTGSSSSDVSSSSSSEHRGWWKSKRGFRRYGKKLHGKNKSRKMRHGRKEVLTPVLQYVTKDGYVIYEKKISKDEAKDWLNVKKENFAGETESHMPNDPNPEMELQEHAEEFLETEPMTERIERLEKNREEEMEITPVVPQPREHRSHKMRMKHRHKNHKKEEETS